MNERKMALGIWRRSLEKRKGHKRARESNFYQSFSPFLCRFLYKAEKVLSRFPWIWVSFSFSIFAISSYYTRDTSTMTIPDSESMVEVGVCDIPCTPEDERRIVTELISEAEANLKEGNLYFVISNRWYKNWQSFVGLLKEEFSSGEHSEVTRPGPIDNHDIIERESDVSDPQIRKMLEEGVDYALVPEKVWEKLVEWYKGGPPIQRKMISQGCNNKIYTVEVYPFVLNLMDDRDKSCTIITLSRKTSISKLYETVCALKEVSKEKARIYDYFDKVKGDLLNPSSEQNLEEASLLTDMDVLLEVNGSVSSPTDTSSAGKELALVSSEPTRSDTTDIMLGGWTPSNCHSNGSKYRYYGRNNWYDDECDSLSRFNGSQYRFYGRNIWDDDECDSLSAFGKGKGRGLVGLQNLGNTCFMNSTLQCLAHTPPIVEYFLQDYSDDINAENPLGMQGQLAIAFGELLRKLWSSGPGTVAPRPFKAKLSRFAPQFSGYNQHDSQEMLAFLLDGLHEDLNKVKRKPYIEAKDSDSRPDDEVAEELWKYHKARNDSVIVDVCQGQYKSTLVCPDCGKISITFDPFMYLTLPLPSSRTRSMTVAVFYGDGSRLWTPYTVTVPKDGCIGDLSTALGTACCLNDDECLLLAEIYQHKVFKYFKEPLDSVSGIKDNDHIVAYRFNKMHIGSGKAILEILHAEQRKYNYGRQLFGTPLVTYIDDEPHSLTDIDAIISRLLSPLHRVHENGHVPDVADETSGSLSPRDTETEGDAAVVDGKLSTEDDAVVVDRKLSFSLLKPDSVCNNFKPIEPDSVVNPGCSSVTKVAVKWNETELEKYDSSYLTHLLPVVYRKDFSLKQPWQEEISMFSCLEAFLGEEPLGPDDMWYCPDCKEHRQANKKLDLWKLPDVLVIHLKRFTYCRYSKDKIDTFVDYPVHDLDLSKYVKSKDGQTYLYELYAVSNHYGSMGGGHYTACAKLMDENKWYCFDDSVVSTADESDIKSSAAYVLFYRRVRSESETSEMEVD